MRDLDAAQHEACHVAVGTMLGLRLRKAVITKEVRDGFHTDGYAWFTGHGSALAHAIMYAAGVVWERAHGRESPLDYKYMLQELNVTGEAEAEIRTCLRIASLLLRNCGPIHKQVTMALLEKDLTSLDIRAIARGEKVDEVE